MQVIEPKEVALGGTDALRVRRTLPSLRRSFVGAWCFADHYGPEQGVCMDVPPHPHTGLQTVSWLFDGEIEHRDSGGVHAMVRPGEVNLMTSGFGIAHSEVSTPERDLLHGVQLWVVLPDSSKDLVREFQHHVPDVVTQRGVRAKVLIGSLDGVTSPVHTQTPLLGADGQAYAVGQGTVQTGSVSAGGASGSSISKGVSTAGRIAKASTWWPGAPSTPDRSTSTECAWTAACWACGTPASATFGSPTPPTPPRG